MARLLGVVDEPDGRRVNRRAVPRLGGLALFLGIFVPALAFLDLGGETRGLLLGAAVATTVGAVDDFRGLRWWEKLGGQMVAAAIPTGFGIWVHRFTFPIVGIHQLPEWVGVPLTVVWIVAIMNMVNFLDGLDGLAAGVCAISAGTFSLIALSLGKPQAAIATAIVLGATLGFLRHTFYPARIFMGDSGALLLGFMLAVISIQSLLKTAAIASLFFPLLVLAVPIIDTSFVVARRVKHGLPVYAADRAHLHHRFLNIGFSQRRAVAYIYFWCGTLAGAALATRFIRPHPHGAEPPLEHVAHGVERPAVASRYDELGERRPRQRVERRVGFPRVALHHQRPHALLELGRECAIGRNGSPDDAARELAEEDGG